tara:strand:+ start:11706 stop:14993 length:3288 start_codon:yes stop_codon:yes gene_type:complete
MAEQTFRSPGFFDNEIDLSNRSTSPSGIPAGVIGTAKRGPAFIPITVGNFADFGDRFGSLDPNLAGPYAVNEFLKNQRACTYVRVLGCGANETTSDITTTETEGTVKNAGFTVSGSGPALNNIAAWAGNERDRRADGAVQFLIARHFVSASFEGIAFPQFSDNQSFPGTESGNDNINLVRAVLFTATGSRFHVLDYNKQYSSANCLTDVAFIATTASNDSGANPNPSFPAYSFKLVLSNSDGRDFATTDGSTGIKVYSCSLNPNDEIYISKVLNTDPLKFQDHKHVLYSDFAVDHEVAPLSVMGGLSLGGVQPTIAIASGSYFRPTDSGNSSKVMQELFGTFATRYTNPKTTSIISQPFGEKEWDLFHVETISDGEVANAKFKLSVKNLKASTNDEYPFGTFDLELREMDDTDLDPQVIEKWPNLNMDPDSGRYIARVIGDKKAFFNFDAASEEERRVVVQGQFPNKSRFIRVIPSTFVKNKDVPKEAMPFGFRGIGVIKTNDTLTDRLDKTINVAGTNLGPTLIGADAARLSFCSGSYLLASNAQPEGILPAGLNLSGAIVPPLPYRFKCTRYYMKGAQIGETVSFAGEQGEDERADSRYYWGVQTVSVPATGTFGSGNNDLFRPNEGTTFNGIVKAYTRFGGIKKLDTLVTGSGADHFNSNKFTLARVALPNGLSTTYHITDISSSANEHMKGAAYIRNGVPEVTRYTIPETALGGRGRITLATLINSSSVVFNRFTPYAKFTTIFHGGFDGLNILNEDQFRMTDKASSTTTGGGMAATDYTDTGLAGGNPAGTKIDNSIIRAYKQAANILTNHHVSNANILAIPGIRDKMISDHAMAKCEENGQVFFAMDLEPFDEDGNRLYSDSVKRPAVQTTSERLGLRNIDNNFVGTYFPDVFINDAVNNQVVKVPASIAAVSALGFNDSAAKPWFAPAGFNRGSLGFVSNVDVRLSAGDRDTLYDARINPIATFPNSGFVIFGQKTLQAAKTALDRINVRRMLIEVKRLIFGVARSILFEQNTDATRARFISQATPLLALVQAGQGIEQFKIVMDSSNNTVEDVEANRLNGRIIVVPTRAVEFIAVDFIITASGVSFE